jgi:hypothetical protein
MDKKILATVITLAALTIGTGVAVIVTVVNSSNYSDRCKQIIEQVDNVQAATKEYLNSLTK